MMVFLTNQNLIIFRTDSDVWKEFLAKPGLSFVLRMLTGIGTKHVPTQVRKSEMILQMLILPVFS